jgi:hypothetical protein
VAGFLPSIADLRQQNGGLANLTDDQIAQISYGHYKDYYPKFEDYAKDIGYKQPGAATAQVKSAFQQEKASLSGVGEAIADRLGLDTTAGWLRSARESGEREAASDAAIAERQGVPQTWDKVDGLGSGLKYGLGQAASFIPMATEMAAGSLATGGLYPELRLALKAAQATGDTRRAAEITAQLNRVREAGAAAGTYPSMVGQNLQAQRQQNGDTDLTSAAGLAIPEAALNMVGPAGRAIADRALPYARAAERDGVTGFATRVMANSVADAGVQGAAMGGQAALEEGARASVDPNYQLDDQAKERIGGAALGGAVVGGFFGAIHGLHRPMDNPVGDKRTPYTEDTQAPPEPPSTLLQGDKTGTTSVAPPMPETPASPPAPDAAIESGAIAKANENQPPPQPPKPEDLARAHYQQMIADAQAKGIPVKNKPAMDAYMDLRAAMAKAADNPDPNHPTHITPDDVTTAIGALQAGVPGEVKRMLRDKEKAGQAYDKQQAKAQQDALKAQADAQKKAQQDADAAARIQQTQAEVAKATAEAEKAQHEAAIARITKAAAESKPAEASSTPETKAEPVPEGTKAATVDDQGNVKATVAAPTTVKVKKTRAAKRPAGLPVDVRSNDALMVDVERAGVGTRVAKINAMRAHAVDELTREQATPNINKADHEADVARLTSRIESLDAIREQAHAKDQADAHAGIERSMLRGARQELETAVKGGKMTPEAATEVVREAATKGSAVAANEHIANAVDKATGEPPAVVSDKTAKARNLLNCMKGKK